MYLIIVLSCKYKNIMQNISDLENLLNSQLNTVDVTTFFFNFILTAICAYFVAIIYRKYGNSISNRNLFSANFVLLALITMLIITVVRYSIALSLGLVGALSVIRFRSAIKEPEELTFLFLTMALGVGFGSGQNVITLLAFLGISVFLIARGLLKKKKSTDYNMLLTVTLDSDKKNNGDNDDIHNKIIEKLKSSAEMVSLKRLDKSPEYSEMLLYVKFSNIEKLNKAEASIRSLDKNLKMSFIEDKGLFS